MLVVISAHINVIFRLNIRKSRSSGLENDNKAACQVCKGDREPSGIRKAKLCRTKQKRANRKGLKFLLRQYIPRSSELHSLCKVENHNLWLLRYSGISFYHKYCFKKREIFSLIKMFLLPFILQQTSCSHVERCHLLLFSLKSKQLFFF